MNTMNTMNTMKDVVTSKATIMTTKDMRSNDVDLQQQHHPKAEQANHQHYRLRRHMNVLEIDNNEDSNGATNEGKGWQGNHQGATNSLDSSYDPGLLYEGDYPVEYSCTEMIDTISDPTAATTLSFYYEATLPKSQDVQSNVEALEWSLLEAAAKRTGLSPKCNLSKQYDNDDYDPEDVDADADGGGVGNRDRQLRLLEERGSEKASNQKESSMLQQQQKRRLDSSLAYPVAVYSINRNPPDAIEDGCVVLNYDPEVDQCVSIKSNMKVHFRGQFDGSLEIDRMDVEAYLKEIFHQGMEENPTSMRVGHVENLAYVGDKDSSGAAFESSNTVSASPSSDDGILLTTVLVGMSTVVFLGVFLLFLRKRRKDDSPEDDEDDVTSPKEIQIVTDEESISVLPDFECGSTYGSSVTSTSSRHQRSKSEGALLLHVHTGDPSIVAKDIMADTTYNRSRDDDDSDDYLPVYQIPVLMRSNSDPTADQRQRQHVQGHVTPPIAPIPGDAGDSPKPPVQEVPMLIRTSNIIIPNLPELHNIDTGLPYADSQESPDSSHGGCSDGGIASTNAVILTATSSGSTSNSSRSSGALPPRPPLRRKNSINLKKKRKRRKKKKKVTLSRVNSRENINEMSMIIEEDENEKAGTDVDGDGTGTEGTPTDGSECTWESGSTGTSESIDDGSPNHSSSCGTPIRNRSPTQSRSNSPKLSPRDELFPSDIFSSDFEFLIEAPDFPYGKGNMKIKNKRDDSSSSDDGNKLIRQPNLTSKPSRSPPPPKDDGDGISPNGGRKIPKFPAPWV